MPQRGLLELLGVLVVGLRDPLHNRLLQRVLCYFVYVHDVIIYMAKQLLYGVGVHRELVWLVLLLRSLGPRGLLMVLQIHQ